MLGERVKIAYLTTKYPSVSHTFIRRELLEIERRGHEVVRMALRRSDAPLVNDIDFKEEEKTFYFFKDSIFRKIFSSIIWLLVRPSKFSKSIRLILSMHKYSEKSLLRHFVYLLEAVAFLNHAEQKQVKHIHSHFGRNTAAITRIIRHLGGPSYSFTVHGPDEFDSPLGYDLSGKIEDSKFTVAITDFCSAQLKRWCRLEDWHKIHTVGCTVGEDFFSRKEPMVDSKTFVCIGRLAPQKGQLVLLDAFHELLAKAPDAKLIFVGDGELRSTIERKIKAFNIADNVEISGYVSEDKVKEFLIESRAMVLPSFAEGLPMVIMESFAVGRPVISTYIAGIPELVVHKENGWLVPSGNSEKLVDAMLEALEAPLDELETMANKGRELTMLKHDTVKEGAVLEMLFNE